MIAIDLLVVTEDLELLDIALGALALFLGLVGFVQLLRLRVRTKANLTDVVEVVGDGDSDLPLAPLSPDQIALRRFTVRTRGYDTSEVDKYLRAVAADYEMRLGNAEAEMAALREAAATKPLDPR